MSINVRSAVLTSPRRTFPVNQQIIRRNPVALQGPIDSFEPVVSQQAQNGAMTPAQPSAPSTSSHGGFFSNLWSSIKGLASGLLGKVSSWFTSNEGGWLQSAKTAVGGLLDGLFSKVGGWFTGLLAAWQNKLS